MHALNQFGLLLHHTLFAKRNNNPNTSKEQNYPVLPYYYLTFVTAGVGAGAVGVRTAPAKVDAPPVA